MVSGLALSRHKDSVIRNHFLHQQALLPSGLASIPGMFPKTWLQVFLVHMVFYQPPHQKEPLWPWFQGKFQACLSLAWLVSSPLRKLPWPDNAVLFLSSLGSYTCSLLEPKDRSDPTWTDCREEWLLQRKLGLFYWKRGTERWMGCKSVLVFLQDFIGENLTASITMVSGT